MRRAQSRTRCGGGGGGGGLLNLCGFRNIFFGALGICILNVGNDSRSGVAF